MWRRGGKGAARPGAGRRRAGRRRCSAGQTRGQQERRGSLKGFNPVWLRVPVFPRAQESYPKSEPPSLKSGTLYTAFPTTDKQARQCTCPGEKREVPLRPQGTPTVIGVLTQTYSLFLQE